MSVFVNTSRGVTSRDPGEILVFLERSTSVDDHKGVDEALEINDPFMMETIIVNSQSEEEFHQNHEIIAREID